jgi:hypothetical protein
MNCSKNIDPNIVPTVGMTFKDIDDAYKFYKSYAYEVGFPLKINTGRKHSVSG